MNFNQTLKGYCEPLLRYGVFFKHYCTYFLLLVPVVCVHAQSIAVNDEDYSAEQMVELLVGDSCMEITNISISSNQSVAYFNNNNSNFPIGEGITIRSGMAKHSEGQYTNSNLNSEINTNSDDYLEDLATSLGEPVTITDVAYLEFDFIPLSNEFQFGFVFASNEYGEWQCGFNDIFAFLLTDLSTNTTTNLALIPGTSDPVSIKNIRDNTYNNNCSSENPELFGQYNVNEPTSSSLNMRGHTVLMTASAQLIPDNPYRIRLVIGDANTSDYDSAIFLQAGTFDTEIDLGEDTQLCTGNTIELTTELDDLEYTHEWTLNGNILTGETSNTLVVEDPGTYAVTITKDGTLCEITDEIVISDLLVNMPADLRTCYSASENYVFDLTQNNEDQLQLEDAVYDVYYFENMPTTMVTTNDAISVAESQNYTTSSDQTIYLKLYNTLSQEFCDAVYEFDLIIEDDFTINTPVNIPVCDNGGQDVIDLTEQNNAILTGLNQANYEVSYYESLADEQNGNAISNPTDFTFTGTSDQEIWVRVTNVNAQECYTTTSFFLELVPLPLVDSLENVTECTEFILPAIENGNYFTLPGGLGPMLNAGDIIEDSGTYYIFSESDDNDCTNETSFTVTLIDEYEIGEDYCEVFTIPTVLEGGFYTESGGPNGSGNLLSVGTEITSDQTIYYYADVNDEFCTEKEFNIQIHSTPEVDELEDIILCEGDIFTLPPLTNGDYYINAVRVNEGTEVTTNQTVIIYNVSENGCTNQTDFTVSFVPDLEDISACGSYTLEALETGNYFTQPNGGGSQLATGTVITDTQTIYVYHPEATCSEDISFTVTINSIPEVDELDDVLLCEGEAYTLPSITNGSYYTGSVASGMALNPGDQITESQTIYIYNDNESCYIESTFYVDIRALPYVENFTDFSSCDPYILPELNYGRYFTESGGNGEELFAGEIITETKTIYIYNEWEDLPGCSNEKVFTFNFLGIYLGEFEDVVACNSYELPVLEQGDYFTEPGGQGTLLPFGTAITESQTVYIYAYEDNRLSCEAEYSYNITITNPMDLSGFTNMEVCGSYDLPLIEDEHNTIVYYWGANQTDIIDLADYTLDEPGTYTIYAVSEDIYGLDCISETQFEVTIYPLLELDVEDGWICVDNTTGKVEEPLELRTGLDANEFVVSWYLYDIFVGTGVDYAVTEPGVYTIVTEKLTPDSPPDCNYATKTIEIKQSEIEASLEVSRDFADNAVITVDVDYGSGYYLYSIDGGEFQEGNIFTNVSSGDHLIVVQDEEQTCANIYLEAVVLKHPNFFTPNGDGVNDQWNIDDLYEEEYQAQISIFDRYGKLIKTIYPNSNGWDGLYRGKLLPSNDYWFVVDYVKDGKNKQYKSHFSLKR